MGLEDGAVVVDRIGPGLANPLAVYPNTTNATNTAIGAKMGSLFNGYEGTTCDIKDFLRRLG